MPHVLGHPASFIVRSAQTQHYGYAYYCAGAVEALRKNPPKDVRELLLAAADALHPLKGGKEMFETIGQQYVDLVAGDTPLEKNKIIFGANLCPMGPQQETLYGVIRTDPITTLIEYFDEDARAGNRVYLATLDRNQPGWRTRLPILFKHNDAGRAGSLPLMKIAYVEHFSSDDKRVKKAAFLHPRSEDFGTPPWEKLVEFLQPLWETLHDPTTSNESKQKAVITFYWLVAQASPVMRGGSAYARVILEHLAPLAELEVPHMREQYDLWAEATTSSLQQFIVNYRSGNLFDRSITDQQVLDWQHGQLAAETKGYGPAHAAQVTALSPKAKQDRRV